MAEVSFDPLSAEYLADPYKQFVGLREDAPVFYAAAIDSWVIARASDIEMVLLDPVSYSSRNATARVFTLSEPAQRVLEEGGFRALPTMVNSDSPTHERLRKVNMRALSPRRIAAMRPVVLAATERLVEAMLAKEQFDLVSDLSFPLPALTIFELLGFPSDDAEMLKGWSKDRVVFLWGCPSVEDELEFATNMVRYWKYCEAFVASRRHALKDDYTSSLWQLHAADPDAVTPDEIRSIVYGLSFSGHETTTNLITNAVRRLMENREAWKALCADRSLVKNAVEECLRYDTSIISWRRRTNCDVEIAGVAIPADSNLLLLLGAANRDPQRFHDPERFDIHRADAARHFAFGRGIHSCMGASLARMETTIVLDILTQRAPDLQLASAGPYRFSANLSFRGPSELWLQQT